jgi:hypothetical protein
MKFLIEVAKGVAEGVSRDDTRETVRTHRTEIDAEVSDLADDAVLLLVEALFGPEPRTDGAFYDALAEFQHRIGYGPAYRALAGRIWARAFVQLQPEKGLELLSSLVGDDRLEFWMGIRCLPTFCSLVELPPSFAAKWFHDLGTRVAQDLAGGDFYDGICRYAETFPQAAFAVFEQYASQGLDPLTVHLAGLLLGTARAKSMSGEINTDPIRRWDAKLRRSAVLQQRLIYDKSLVTSFNLGALSIPQLRTKLAKMLKGTAEEVSEAFDVVGRCLRKDRREITFTCFALQWYKRYSSGSLPDLAKHYLVKSLWLFFTSKDVPDRGSVISQANDLVIAIQPIPPERRGTWQEMESYLVSVLEFDQSTFNDVFSRLIKSNPAGVLKQIRESGFLEQELGRAKCDALVTGLLLSPERDEWEIGKSLFADGAINTLSDEVLGKAKEPELEIALLQSVRSPFLATGTSRYLSQLEPYFRRTGVQLQNAFRKELTLQAMNYPGACLEAWKTRKAESPLMSEAIGRAEQHFEDVSKLRDSPAVSFSFPGYDSAQQKAGRAFGGKVMREAMEESVFARFAKHFEIVYGDRWATFIGGRMDGPSPFSEHSHSMELPRLEVIDPEGMTIRRIQASSRLRLLGRSI